MSMRGRPPKPVHLTAIDGGAAALPRGREPDEVLAPTRVVAGAPARPDVLVGRAADEWDRLVPLLLKAGLLADFFGGPLACYCQAYGRWVQAEEQLRQLDAVAGREGAGYLVKTPNGYPIQNPLLGIANKAMEQMRQFAGEFGMTPSALTRAQRAPDVQGDLFPPAGGDDDDFSSWHKANCG